MSHPDHEKNRALWNEVVDIHFSHPSYRTTEFLGGQSTLKRLELDELGDVRGKSLLHLMCQFGLDTLSWARLGAQVTGVDISDKSIDRANELERMAGLDGARFVRSDVLDLPDVLDGQFDIIYQSYGTVLWIADIPRWARTVAHYLKPGGTFLLIDEHPVSILFVDNDTPLHYFSREPERAMGTRDYCDREYIRKNEDVEWQHPVSEILNSLIDAGLTISRFNEYDFGYYQVDEDWYEREGWWYPPGGPTPFPLLMLVRATK